ncbi:sugar transferase [Oscillospiraceae bacterium HV4-5-C5C]|nr:sugar transferase [Oscillospiraceae bacterium HV4-5-C5C]
MSFTAADYARFRARIKQTDWQAAYRAGLARQKRRRGFLIIKRLGDLILSLLLLLLLLIPFAIIALTVKLDSPGPVFFKQQRMGRDLKPFAILKFRTMTADAEQRGRQITVGADRRITRTGAVLRRYKLDELPQFINVLKGDMSIVGPRPEVPRYVAAYPEVFRVLLLTRPGITDRASLVYRDENQVLEQSPDPERSYLEEVLPAKLCLALDYQQEAGVFRDLRLIFQTAARMKS